MRRRFASTQVSCPHRMMVILRPHTPADFSRAFTETSRAVVALTDPIEGREIGGIELDLDRSHVLLEVRDRVGARDQQHPVVASKQPRKAIWVGVAPCLSATATMAGSAGQSRRPARERRTKG